MDTTSYWRKSARLPRFPALAKDLTVDVVVIGGGITGITTAYLLKKCGHKVALLERGAIGGFDTANTTAHLTYVTDTRLHELVDRFGQDTARAAWDGGKAAIDFIAHAVREEGIACDFSWVPGYLHLGLDSDAKKEQPDLRKDCHLANAIGFPAQALETVPIFNRYGVEFPRQAKFHPLRYAAGLLKTIPGQGSYVFENTASTEINRRPLQVKTDKYKIRCGYLVLATHNPLTGNTDSTAAFLFQTKLFLYTSYVVGARLPAGSAPEASFWDTKKPYRYLRIDRRPTEDYAILGGGDHKTGQIDDPARPYRELEEYLKRVFPKAAVDARWSGQVIDTPDGLPFIGESAPRQFTATGFSGNGMTYGTLGAMMAVDAYHQRKNPWQELFDVHRKKILGGTWAYLRENKDYPFYMVQGWLSRGEGKSLKSLRRGQGKVLQLEGKKVAAYRAPDGAVSVCSAVCTHLQCIVRWNGTEKTWDCPCHGSRFAPTGEVLTGPAEEPLPKIHSS